MAFDTPEETTTSSEIIVLEYRVKHLFGKEKYVRVVGTRTNVEELFDKAMEK